MRLTQTLYTACFVTEMCMSFVRLSFTPCLHISVHKQILICVNCPNTFAFAQCDVYEVSFYRYVPLIIHYSTPSAWFLWPDTGPSSPSSIMRVTQIALTEPFGHNACLFFCLFVCLMWASANNLWCAHADTCASRVARLPMMVQPVDRGFCDQSRPRALSAPTRRPSSLVEAITNAHTRADTDEQNGSHIDRRMLLNRALQSIGPEQISQSDRLIPISRDETDR